MQQAWNVAFVAFLGFIDALAFGELIASGVHPNTGTRCEIDPVEWMRTGLILDVRNGDLIEVVAPRASILCGGRPSRCERPNNPDKRRHAGTAMIGRSVGLRVNAARRRPVGLEEVSARREATIAVGSQGRRGQDQELVRGEGQCSEYKGHSPERYNSALCGQAHAKQAQALKSACVAWRSHHQPP